MKKEVMNICQPENPAEFYTEDETFYLYSPNMFNSNGDLMQGPPGPISETDCTFTVTPKNPDERIWISAPWLAVDAYINGVATYMTEFTTNMFQCGDTYLSINGARNCGEGSFDNYVPLAGPGQSVVFNLKASNSPLYFDLHFGPDGLIIFTGTEIPTISTPPPYTPPPSTTDSNYIPPYLTTDSPPTFINAGSLNHNADICAGNYKYNATGYPSGSIQSPNYPGTYPSDSNCSNRISTASNGITFVIDYLSVEEFYDGVIFYDSSGTYIFEGVDPDDNNYSYKSYDYGNGPQVGDRFSFSDSQVDVRFVSDYIYQYSGFSFSVIDGYEPANDINNLSYVRRGNQGATNPKRWPKKTE